jgi:hypothetical protein
VVSSGERRRTPEQVSEAPGGTELRGTRLVTTGPELSLGGDRLTRHVDSDAMSDEESTVSAPFGKRQPAPASMRKSSALQ